MFMKRIIIIIVVIGFLIIVTIAYEQYLLNFSNELSSNNIMSKEIDEVSIFDSTTGDIIIITDKSSIDFLANLNTVFIRPMISKIDNPPGSHYTIEIIYVDSSNLRIHSHVNENMYYTESYVYKIKSDLISFIENKIDSKN